MEQDTNQTAVIVLPEFDQAAAKLNAPEEKKLAIANTLQTYFAKYEKYKSLINTLVVDDVNDTGSMAMAREGRLDLRRNRIDAQNLIKAKRDDLKIKMADDVLEDTLWLRAGQIVVALFDDLETKLLEKEKFAETEFAKQKKELADSRRVLLAPYAEICNPAMYDLENMPEDGFQMILKAVQHSWDEKVKQEAEQKEKKERFLKRRDELSIAGLKFNGTTYLVGDTHYIGITDLSELDEEKYQSVLQSAKEHLQRLEDEAEQQRLELEKIKADNEKIKFRLSKLTHCHLDENFVWYHKYNNLSGEGVAIMPKKALLEMPDDKFEESVTTHARVVQQHEKERQEELELKRLNELRFAEMLPYVHDGMEVDMKNLGVFTDKKYAEILKNKKDAHAARIEKERLATEAAENEEKLKTGSDKEKLQQVYDSLKLQDLNFKTKKAKAAYEQFVIEFSKAADNLKTNISKL